MEYAVIKTGGKQYKVTKGNYIDVDKLEMSSGSSCDFNNVLLYISEGICKIGQPKLDGFVVKGKIIDQHKGPKIRVAKFKAKARYRKVTGHRAQLTRVLIENIITTKDNQESSQPAASVS